MVDYDLPMIDSDKRELTEEKFLVLDKQKNENILYAQLMKELGPKEQAYDVTKLTKFVIRI